ACSWSSLVRWLHRCRDGSVPSRWSRQTPAGGTSRQRGYGSNGESDAFGMYGPRILVMAGSLRAGSHNGRLAALVAKELALAEADVTRISLADYPLPLLDTDLLADSGPPDNAVKLKRTLSAHQGVFIASPEYTASVAPLLKNAVDWITRVRERDDGSYAAFKDRVFALGSASARADGGVHALLALRQILEVGCGAL